MFGQLYNELAYPSAMFIQFVLSLWFEIPLLLQHVMYSAHARHVGSQVNQRRL